MEVSLTELRAINIPIVLPKPRTPSIHNLQTTTDSPSKSSILLAKIYKTLNSPSNHRSQPQHKQSVSLSLSLSLSIQQTEHQQNPTNCKCKKSKCLKLYCQCFSNGSYCKDCNCQSCHNTEQFAEIRAKAIDQVIVRAAVPFGHKSSGIKGCHCKKTGCVKKYCECYGAGDKCSEYCKCENCANS